MPDNMRSNPQSIGHMVMRRGANIVHANIVTWRLTHSVRDPEDYQRYLKALAERNIPILRRFGLLDSFVLRMSEDTVQVVNVFEDEAGAESAWAEINGSLAPAIEGHLELMERISARADDLPLLMDFGD
jgi:hypothetical protein